MNKSKSILCHVLCLLSFIMIFNGSLLTVDAQGYNANNAIISQINTYIYDYNGETVKALIDNNIQDFSNKKLKQELKLSMMYDTDLFYNLFTEEDYENSIKVIIELEKSNYKTPKMLLYKSLYLKTKGEWDIALQVLDKSIEMLEAKDCNLVDKTFYLAKAKFEKGLMTPDQKLIVEAIDILIPLVDEKLDNIVYLNAVLDVLRFIDIPKDLYDKYKDKLASYEAQFEKINKELIIINYKNLLCLKEKREQEKFENVMKPLTEEILSRWKVPLADQNECVNLLYYFQIAKNRKIINIKLIAEDNASEKLQESSYGSIQDAIIAHLLDGYKFDTMGVLFIFSSE